MIKKYYLSSLFDELTFKAHSKVHLQRNVMREIDERLAKYSRRGLWLSVVVFMLTMWIGNYYARAPEMSLVLSVGLLLITFSRAYFLFRFDSSYACGPARWRKIFFCYSFLGSLWWGGIVASITWLNGVEQETSVLWLYTAAFFAGSIYVFAPFQRFLKIYMFVSFIPCATVAIFLWQPISILYGIIMIILYILLSKQGKVIGKNYWDKLDATYDLLKKANTLQAEKISTESSLNNRDILYANLTQELKTAMQEIDNSLGFIKDLQLSGDDEKLVLLAQQKTQQQITLLKNVTELSSISSKKLLLDQRLIDVRYHIEQALNNVSLIAHKKNIELYSAFSTNFPLRVRADAERIEQLIGNLVSSACQFCPAGELLVTSRFDANDDALGTLSISVCNQSPPKNSETLETINASFSPYQTADIHLGLSLGIVKGIARLMGGDAGANFDKSGALVFWMDVSLPLVSSSTVSTPTLSKLVGKRVMLYQAPNTVIDIFSSTLESWGLKVDNVSDEGDAMVLLEQSVNRSPYQLVIIYTLLNDISGLSFSKKIAEHAELWATSQIVILSRIQTKNKKVEEHFLKYVNTEVIYKPIQQRHLQKTIKYLLGSKKDVEITSIEDNLLLDKNILLYQEEDIDIAIMRKMLEKIGVKVTVATTLENSIECLSAVPFDAFICESHMYSVDLADFVSQARVANQPAHNSGYQLPVLGITSHELEGEQAQCLASGMEYYIHSPIDIDDLQAVLRRFIGRAIHMNESH